MVVIAIIVNFNYITCINLINNNLPYLRVYNIRCSTPYPIQIRLQFFPYFIAYHCKDTELMAHGEYQTRDSESQWQKETSCI